jgi:hypothetical protein
VWLLSNRGNVNCDDLVDSRDALAVLQVVAGLLKDTPCDPGAVAGQALTSLVALEILQFNAGLLA